MRTRQAVVVQAESPDPSGAEVIACSFAEAGQINRIKLIKRQMSGRANIDLLRKRVLLA